MTRPFLNTPNWAWLRRRALERDGYRCQWRADDSPHGGRPEVDHIRPVIDGGAESDIDNLQTLCKHHHVRKTSIERDRRTGVDPERARWRARVKEMMA